MKLSIWQKEANYHVRIWSTQWRSALLSSSCRWDPHSNFPIVTKSKFQLKKQLLLQTLLLSANKKLIHHVPDQSALWLSAHYPDHREEQLYPQLQPTYRWGLERVRTVSTAPFLSFGCTTAALAINPPIECPTRMTLVGRISPLSSLCCDRMWKELLYLSRICHNESLSILNKTMSVPAKLLESCKIKKLSTHSSVGKENTYAESTRWTACTTYSECSSRIQPSMAECSPSKSTANQSRWLAYCRSTVTPASTSARSSPSGPASRGVKEDCW